MPWVCAMAPCGPGTANNPQSPLLAVSGAEEFLRTTDYPEHAPFIWELNGVVSRKKQLLPYMLGCLARMTR